MIKKSRKKYVPSRKFFAIGLLVTVCAQILIFILINNGKSTPGTETKWLASDPVKKFNTDSTPINSTPRAETDRVKIILEQAGVDVKNLKQSIPSWNEVASMYGNDPTIYGLDTCANFRSSVPNQDAWIAPAGSFNTGTNLLADLLDKNCYLPDRLKNKKESGMRWQVPWGKHWPLSERLDHIGLVNYKAAPRPRPRVSKQMGRNHLHPPMRGKQVAIPFSSGEGVDPKTVLPVIIVKDPLNWIKSMCREPYLVHGTLKKVQSSAGKKYIRRKVAKICNKMQAPIVVTLGKRTTHSSLADLWNDWYSPWFNATFPRVIIRYEDIIFHPKKVLTQVCECGGGRMHDEFQFPVEKAKDSGSGLLEAVRKYGSVTRRLAEFEDDELEYINSRLDSSLLQDLHYKTQ